MTNLYKLTLVILSLAASTFYAGDEAKADAELLGGPIKVSGSFSGRSSWADAKQPYADNTSGVFFVRLEARLAKNIKAYLGGYLFRRLRVNGQNVEITPLEIDKFLSTANIEIRNVGGKPIAFIIGKQRVPFGSKIRKMPSFVNDPTYFPVNFNAGVFGFTIKLEQLPFFDLVEISGFESQAGDLEIGTIDGASLRLTKDFSRRLKARASYMKKGHTDNELREAEEKMSLGLIFDDGTWSTWVEGSHVNGNLFYPDLDNAFVAGVSRKVGDATVVVQVTYLVNKLRQIGAGVSIPLDKFVTFNAETRYTEYSDGSSAWSVSISTRVKFNFRFGRRETDKREDETIDISGNDSVASQ